MIQMTSMQAIRHLIDRPLRWCRREWRCNSGAWQPRRLHDEQQRPRTWSQTSVPPTLVRVLRIAGLVLNCLFESNKISHYLDLTSRSSQRPDGCYVAVHLHWFHIRD